MGQKVKLLTGLESELSKTGIPKWYAEKDFADNLVEDHEIRRFEEEIIQCRNFRISRIQRVSDCVNTIVYSKTGCCNR